MSVMPAYNLITLPGAKLWLHTRIYREMTGKDPEKGERVTVLIQKEEQPRGSLKAASFPSKFRTALILKGLRRVQIIRLQ